MNEKAKWVPIILIALIILVEIIDARRRAAAKAQIIDGTTAHVVIKESLSSPAKELTR